MPKKKEKKSGDKQDESKKTSKKESSVTPADITGPEDKEKELYLTQIRYLNERLEGYQHKCDELERRNKDLISQYSTLEREKKDVVGFLKRSLLDKEAEVDDALEQLEDQRQAADQDRDALQLQHSQLRRELQERIDELSGENGTLREKLSSLEEFQKQKETLTSHMECLEKQLAAQREEHKDDMHSLEMKALLEKKRLEKELESHAAAMAAEVQHLVDQKVPEATRLALQENTEVKARFSQLSEQAQVLMEKNAALRGRKGQLSVDVDVLEQMLSKVSRTSCIRKKVVEQLTAKCQQLQAEQRESRQQLEQLRTEHTGVLAEMEALRQDRASVSVQCSEIKAEVGRLEVELQEERKRRSEMKTTMQEAAITIRQILMEAPVELDSEVDSVSRWKQLMQKLLVDLDRRAFIDSNTENDKLNDLQAPDPAAARTVSSDPDSTTLLHLTHNRPGDLSYLPRRSATHKNITCRTGAAANSIHLPLHRKPSSQKKLS